MNPALLSSFNVVFSPAKYGWRQALALNCMKFLKENEDVVRREMEQDRGNGVFMAQFTETTGTEHDADYLSHHFMNAPQIIALTIRLDGCVGVIGRPLKDALFGEDEPTENCCSSDGAVRQICLLRRSLYFTPRNIAFLSGKHARLGGASLVRILSEDVCELILKFAMI